MEELFVHANYEGHVKMVKNHRWWTNTKNNDSRILSEEQIFSGSTNGLIKKVLQRLLQESVEWIINLASKFCKARALVLDTITGTSASAKACLQLPEHRRFV